jgi:hypothetical protein
VIEMTEEKVLFEGAASFQKNVETIGGKLKLFKDKLVFIPHTFNVQKEAISVDLKSINKLSASWTKFLGVVPIFPNAILIADANKDYRFTVFSRDTWIEKINGVRLGINKSMGSIKGE